METEEAVSLVREATRELLAHAITTGEAFMKVAETIFTQQDKQIYEVNKGKMDPVRLAKMLAGRSTPHIRKYGRPYWVALIDFFIAAKEISTDGEEMDSGSV